MSLSRHAASRLRRSKSISWTRGLGKRSRSRSYTTKFDESAGVAVVTGEDTATFRDRLLAWTGDLGPRDDVEHYLVRLAVALSCAFDRFDAAPRSRAVGGISGGDPHPAADDATVGVGPPSISADKLGERVRAHQLTCATALVGTLDAFIRLRQLGGSGSTASAAPGEAPRPAAGPVAARSTSAAGPSEEARAEEAEPARTCEPQVVRDVPGSEEPSSPDRPPIRHRIGRRRRQPEWPASDGPANKDSSGSGDKCDPAARSTREVEGSWSVGDSRRRVGGYLVPLDPSTPASRADRVPIRLRRHESGVRYARAAAPSSSLPKTAPLAGRDLSRRHTAR
jgi:hypothetical protein